MTPLTALIPPTAAASTCPPSSVDGDHRAGLQALLTVPREHLWWKME